MNDSGLTIWNKAVARDVRDGRLEVPSMDEFEWWVFDSLCEAACTCGAQVEPDGYCEHGRPSWLLAVGLV